MTKPFVCRLGWHKWVTRSTEDGKKFRQCSRCSRDDGQGKIHWFAGQG
ncbi:hypothetical protein [Paractinoplanes rishiriensis]|uniref:Uncharacterized protein n=1 Tax=Paractinoplanes rishiriensis TaxID=1050105 RepID=A0A919MS96_9ACTN|nr:hypothetical protein [Actinoplanes rishiriensis]GIE93428.1 hypothetical protein Ari01nite_08930 [Actinoplanes rishiriensis]